MAWILSSARCFNIILPFTHMARSSDQNVTNDLNDEVNNLNISSDQLMTCHLRLHFDKWMTFII